MVRPRKKRQIKQIHSRILSYSIHSSDQQFVFLEDKDIGDMPLSQLSIFVSIESVIANFHKKLGKAQAAAVYSVRKE